jgi:hypothetical protein
MKQLKYPEQINVAVSDKMKQELDEISLSQKISVSEYVRDAIWMRMQNDRRKAKPPASQEKTQ